MLKKKLCIVAGILPLLVGSHASAGWNSFFLIDYLDTTTYPGPASDGYAISGPGTFSGGTSNPAGCTGSLNYAYPSPDVPAGAARELLAKTVFSAYLAGKQVRLYISSTNCLLTNGTLGGTGSAGAPVYLAVAVQ
jgi:hypothetical protein